MRAVPGSDSHPDPQAESTRKNSPFYSTCANKGGGQIQELDILNRKEFVNQLTTLIENISANRSSTRFAINGTWGSGKTFVLDMLQEQLGIIQCKETSTNKYLIIPYNCWKFDYYEEPLVAIVLSMISKIEEQTALFPNQEKRQELLGNLKAVSFSLMSIGSDFAKEKLGFDLHKAAEAFHEHKSDSIAVYQKMQDFDLYFNFKKVLNRLSDLLKQLAEIYTIVFLVDELDRCIPEYAVKVLERLHHLTEDQANTITIVSIDRTQLMTSVTHIFGFTNPEKYLEKFINFEVKLDYGVVSETIFQKYSAYFGLFDKNIFPFENSLEEYIQAIFDQINIRTQKQLIKKAELAHNLLYRDKKDYTFMCMELLITVMICIYQYDFDFFKNEISLSSFDSVFVVRKKSKQPPFNEFFKSKFSAINFESMIRMGGESSHVLILPKAADLYGAILLTWVHMHSNGDHILIPTGPGSVYDTISENPKELRKFAETIKMIV